MVSWHSASGQLGKYRLLQPIGQGGTSVVHLAAGPGGEMVAVKMLRPPHAGEADTRSRLAREVCAMRRIRSPFVAEVIDADVTGSIPYVVTRLVQGRTLAQVVASDGPLRGNELKRLAYGLAQGLAAVHSAGIVHRDLKPGNVMMAGGDPVLIDFGIAYQAGDSPMTETGTFIGTPGYLAPEVINGQHAQAPADVHAWGTTVGFAARGEPVYGTGPFEQVFCRILRSAANLDGIHEALLPLVAGALLRQPSQRPTAAWLASRTADLDLEAPEPARASRASALAVRTVPLPAVTAKRAPQPVARRRPDEFADLLPAVKYTPPPWSKKADVQAAVGARRHPVLSLAALVVAIGASYFLPVAGTLTVAAVLAFLRAGDKARSSVAGRREARGPRAWDCLLAVWSAPWALARSVLETLLLAPVLVGAAAVAVTSWIIWFHAAQMLPDWPAIAAAYTTLSCLGPRSRPVRRELSRGLSAVASTPLGAAVALLTAGVAAMTVAGLVLVQAPPMWPLPHLPSMIIHVTGFNLARFHG